MPTYSEKQFQQDLKELNSLIGSFKKGGSKGGSKGGTKCGAKQQEDFMTGGSNNGPDVRSFTLVSIDKEKIVNGGRHKISNVYTRGSKKGKPVKNKPTPLDAAKKAFTSKCKAMKSGNKSKCRITFEIQETTRGSNKKVYGPYYGYMKKLDKPRIVTYPGKKPVKYFFIPHVKLVGSNK
tara:strand:- start:2639 stop:3175 length:537 start_codon:yes stop_codon:yes gene_type:complete